MSLLCPSLLCPRPIMSQAEEFLLTSLIKLNKGREAFICLNGMLVSNPEG